MTNLILILALTIMSEARGEAEAGRQAVASVIWNRAQESGQALVSVCLAPKQFSFWNNNRPSVALAKKWRKEAPETYAACEKIARSIVAGTFKPTIKATHFYNPKLARPSWGSRLRAVVRIGNHKFGRV